MTWVGGWVGGVIYLEDADDPVLRGIGFLQGGELNPLDRNLLVTSAVVPGGWVGGWVGGRVGGLWVDSLVLWLSNELLDSRSGQMGWVEEKKAV